MSTIRVAWGSATGPTAMAAYDTALADANVHDYNLVRLSSVIPADAPVERVGTVSDLGPAGNRLPVVEARATVEEGQAVAGLGWAVNDAEHGIFYETAGESEATVRDTIETGLRAGRDLRGWSAADIEIVTETITPTTGVEPTEASPMADGAGSERGEGQVGQRSDERVESDRHGNERPAAGRERSAERGSTDAYATAVVLASYGRSDPIV